MSVIWAKRRWCAGLAALLVAASSVQAEGVNFQWRADDLQRQQRAFATPRQMFDEALKLHQDAQDHGDVARQLTTLVDAASAAVWLGPDDGDAVLDRVPKLLASLLQPTAHQRVSLLDLFTSQGLLLLAAGRLDDAHTVLDRAEDLRRSVQDPGQGAALELAWGLLTLLRDDAPGALDRFATAQEFAVHDLMRGLISMWQAAVSRRASYYKYDLLRVSLLKAREADRLVPPDLYPAHGVMNVSILAQSEALLGEQYEAVQHSRQFARLVTQQEEAQAVDYSRSAMVRILSQFRRQDLALAEQLGKRRVLLTWGLLAAALIAGTALTAIFVQARQRRSLTAASMELESRNRQLQAFHSSHTRLLAASCHDLREPAHALCLMAELAATEADQKGGSILDGAAARTDEHLATIRYCSMRLTDMLSELLDLTRIEAGQYVLERSLVSLHTVLDEVGLYFHDHARRQGIRLEVVDTELYARTDPYLLRRILFSLVSTAVKTTRAGQVRVSTQQDRLGHVQIRVQDSSPGMPPEVLSAMLDRGTDLSRDTVSSQDLDLGVSIVKRAAELLEIGLEVSSQAGRGNLVKLTLEHAPAPETLPAGGSQVATKSTGALTVALLEDDADARHGMEALLRHWGYEVVTGSAAAELEQHFTGPDSCRPALLITDLHLGALNGLQEAALMRSWPGCEDLPVLLITGEHDDAITREAAQAGIQLNYKPLLPRQLLSSIQVATHSSIAAAPTEASPA